jgi:hypothetical protein
MTFQSWRGEQGSLPMVLVAAIAIGGVVVTLFSTVSLGQETARRDRDWNGAVQVADAGVQHALSILKDVPVGDNPPCDPTGTGSCTEVLGTGGEYTWEYTRLGPENWEVRSAGTQNGETRFIEANIGPRQLFPVSILSKTRVRYNGGGGGTEPFTVGTFDEVTLNGGPANGSVAAVVLYGPPPHNVSTDGSQPVESGGDLDLENLGEAAFQPGGACDGATVTDVYPAGEADPQRHGQVYCTKTVRFEAGHHPLVGNPADGPVTVYVDNVGNDALIGRPHARVNWSATGDVPGNASMLQIYIAGGPVTFNGHAKISAAIWAPESTCTSNGTPDVAGSLVCNEVILNGNFWYDADVGGLVDGPFTVNNWAEQYADS